MNLPNLSELSKIIDLCRKKGVESIKIDNVELTLSKDAPASKYKRKNEPQLDVIPVDELYGDDAALFWSAPNPQEEING